LQAPVLHDASRFSFSDFFFFSGAQVLYAFDVDRRDSLSARCVIVEPSWLWAPPHSASAFLAAPPLSEVPPLITLRLVLSSLPYLLSGCNFSFPVIGLRLSSLRTRGLRRRSECRSIPRRLCPVGFTCGGLPLSSHLASIPSPGSTRGAHPMHGSPTS